MAHPRKHAVYDENKPKRPVDRTRQDNGLSLTVKEKNAEVAWVLRQYKRLYSNYRIAERDLQIAEQNGRHRVSDTIMFNRAQFCLEYALGLTIPVAKEAVAEDLRWLTPELKQLRNRALGKFS